MLERDGYPAGVPCWIDTEQPDPAAAAAFYGELFGWEFDEREPAGWGRPYRVARLRGRDVAGIAAAPAGAAAAWQTYVAVDAADAAVDRVGAAGGAVLDGPSDAGEAGRTATVADPSGAPLRLWEARGHRGAQLVNEPGTWNFSELNTPDPDGARSFYRAVFGWEIGGYGGEGGFWRAPGYGDFLERGDPDVRTRHAEIGAPEGFVDAVAWLVPTAGHDGPPHWSLTFAVDDADAIAETAARLGGTVLVPPTDAPWVRSTVVRDPQGAVFTASRFVPPT